jgi:hypothetical protein
MDRLVLEPIADHDLDRRIIVAIAGNRPIPQSVDHLLELLEELGRNVIPTYDPLGFLVSHLILLP